MCCLNRQEVSALHADFVRRRAEEEAYYTQQVFSKLTWRVDLIVMYIADLIIQFVFVSNRSITWKWNELNHFTLIWTQELLQKAEEQRRNILAQEEEKLTQQRAK